MLKIAAFFTCLLSFNALALDAEQFEIGKKKSRVCMTCHGVDGESLIDPYPNLKDQRASYILLALKAYKDHNRDHGFAILMQQQASSLTEQDMKDIAYYFSNISKNEQQGK